MVKRMSKPVVDETMRDYYDLRAGEYDDWWRGTGLFARRPRAGWAPEVGELVAKLAALPPARVLDVACGTGFLTRHLRGEVVGLDQSAQMLVVAAARAPSAGFVQGDAVPLPFADGAFDRVLTGHFYGHLLADERERFLVQARRVAPELVVVDSAQREDVPAEAWDERRLNDGSRHRVFKRWFTPEGLAGELRAAGGGEETILHAGRWFVAVLSRAPPTGGGCEAPRAGG
jgi:SAM-dependent methyltransferase